MLLEKLNHLKNKENTPIFADINTLLKIQEKYGEVRNWLYKLGAEGETIDYEAMKWTVMTFVNEGISLQNYEKNEDTPLITENLAGALITAYGINKMMEKIVECYANCMGEQEEEDPNLMTKESQ